MRPTALLLALVLAPAGCLGLRMDPLDIDVEVGPISPGSVRLADVEADARHDALQGRTSARVTGEARTSASVEGVWVRVYLVEGRCPTGPSGAPDRHVDRQDVALGRVATHARFEAEVSAPSLPGAPLSVRVLAEPAGLGPAFATCLDITPLPA